MLNFKNKLLRTTVNILIVIISLVFIVYFFTGTRVDYIGKLEPQTLYEEIRDLGSPTGTYPRYSASYITGWHSWSNGAETVYLGEKTTNQDYECALTEHKGHIQAFGELGRPVVRADLETNESLGSIKLYLRISTNKEGGKYGLAANSDFTDQYIKRNGATELFYPIQGGTENFMCLEQRWVRLDEDQEKGELNNSYAYCTISFDPTTSELKIVDSSLLRNFGATVNQINKNSDATITRGTCSKR